MSSAARRRAHELRSKSCAPRSIALRGNWMRSALTSLGVIIGIAAVIVMVSVGQGTQAEIDKLVSGLGSQPPRHQLRAPAAAAAARASAAAAASRSTEDDARRDPRARSRKCSTSPARLRGSTQVVYAENNWSTQLAGRAGRTSSTSTAGRSPAATASKRSDYSGAAKVVILGETVRRELFGDEDPARPDACASAACRSPWSARSSRRARAASARTRTTWSWCRWKPRAAG